jgi:hypothetical protein
MAPTHLYKYGHLGNHSEQVFSTPPVRFSRQYGSRNASRCADCGSLRSAHDRSRPGIRVKQRQFALLTAECPMHGPDDVAPLTERPERCLGLGRQLPYAAPLFPS